MFQDVSHSRPRINYRRVPRSVEQCFAKSTVVGATPDVLQRACAARVVQLILFVACHETVLLTVLNLNEVSPQRVSDSVALILIATVVVVVVVVVDCSSSNSSNLMLILPAGVLLLVHVAN